MGAPGGQGNDTEMEQMALAAPHADVSIWGLFMQAGWVVKLVMIGLLVASVWTWAIIVDKMIAFSRMRLALNRFEEIFWSGQSLEELYKTLSERKTTGMGAIFVAAMREWKKSFEKGARSPMALQTRIDKAMDLALGREMERLESRLGFLATVGSAGPFIGLFGTVYGMVNAFGVLSATGAAEPAQLAGDIQIALLTTFWGLLTAIPSLVAYFYFKNRLNNLVAEAHHTSEELINASIQTVNQDAYLAKIPEGIAV